MAKMKEAKEGFTLIKQAVGFHDPAMMRSMTNGWYDEPRTGASHPDRGLSGRSVAWNKSSPASKP